MDKNKEHPTLSSDLELLLGAIESSLLEKIHTELTALGVETIDDLRWIEEKDLQGKQSPVLSRKLLSAYKAKMAPGSNSTSERSMSESPCSSLSRSPMSTSSSPRTPSPMNLTMHGVNRDPNWPLKVEVPVTSLSSDILMTLQEGKRLSAAAKRELVNHTVDEIRKKTHHATRHQLSIIAQRYVSKFPDSLEDRIDSTIIGSGYQTWVDKMVARNENLNRSKSVVKRPHSQSEDEETRVTKKIDSYGCVKWEPQIDDEEYEPLKVQRDEMKEMSINGNQDQTRVDTLLNKTYPLQRMEINSGTAIKDMKIQWPFLFQSQGLLIHSKELLALDVRDAVCNAYSSKGARLKCFFKRDETSSRSVEYFKEAEKQSNLDNLKAWLMAVVLSVMDHFKEKKSEMFHVVDETASISEVEENAPTEDPVIVVLGETILSGRRYLLMVDRIVITEKMGSFIDALATYFATFYVFNLEYPVGTTSTLEFIQRCFMMINPDKGSKGNKGKKKKRQISPKVLKLVNQIADFEWMDTD